jgi:Xaa-Pro aminopeptidase
MSTSSRVSSVANIPDPISREEYAERRARVLAGLDAAVGLVFAGEQHGEEFACDPSFAYLTGVTSEPGAAILFDPRAENPDRRVVLFLKPRDIEREAWDGSRDPINGVLRERLGFPTVMRTTSIPAMLTAACRLRKRAACLHKLAVYDAPVSPDLAAFRKVAERVPGVAIEDRSDILARLRAIKSPAELGLMGAAIRATAMGHAAAARALVAPSATEATVATALSRAFEDAGAQGHAYGPIVGGGPNACILHYRANSAPIAPGQLLVLDAGAKVRGYCADVTRTFPTDGRFTPRQRQVYEMVLEAQVAALNAVRPGVHLFEVDAAAREVFRRHGVLDYYLHGIGHQLGLETHDIAPDGPLQPGMVVTIEPGLYFADEGLGVRIEDDVLVTATGCDNLTRDIPKDAAEVERMVRG